MPNKGTTTILVGNRNQLILYLPRSVKFYRNEVGHIPIVDTVPVHRKEGISIFTRNITIVKTSQDFLKIDGHLDQSEAYDIS